MRHASLRLVLIAGAALAALPALAQEPPAPAPAIAVDPAGLSEEAAPPAEPATPAIPQVWAPVPFDGQGRSAYGLYLSARLAGFRGEHGTAADFLTDSQILTPEQPELSDEAFRAALFAGDLDSVVRLTPAVQDTPSLAEVARMAEAVQLLADGDGRAAYAALRRQPFAEPPFPLLARYLTPAFAAGAEDWDTALKPVEATPDIFTALVLRLQRARALEARRRFDEAEAEFRALTSQGVAGSLFNAEFGEFLERRGRRDEAAALYQANLTGPAPDPAALTGLNRIQARGRPPAALTPAQAASEALEFAALQMMALEQPEPASVAAIYLRMAERLQPSDELTLRLGHALAGAQQKQLARAAYARVGPADPVVYVAAQYNLALNLQEDEQGEAALEALRRADAAAPGQIAVVQQLAAQLLDLGRNEDALAVVNRPGVNVEGQSPELRFLRGAALERLGRVEEAEGELWAALQAQPDDPMLLNHLGYLWVDSGRRVDQGAEMIARAHAADPDNGSIQDSLGWAQYRQGQYDLAVETLEGAVTKEPGNAEIVDHLGDAYWQVGRRREAEWQWARVLTLEPEPERRVAVERKLVAGLPAQTPVIGARP